MDRKIDPPKWMDRFMEWFCDPRLLEGIQGDLAEAFHHNVNTRGVAVAKRLYLMQAFGFVRYRFARKTKRSHNNMRAMWNHNFLSGFRSIKRHKMLFAINLTGLVLAISCVLFAYLFISDELQMDRKVAGSDNIFRLYKHYLNEPEGIDEFSAETSGLMGPTLLDEYPEVTSSLRINPWYDNTILTTEDGNSFDAGNLYFTDSTFADFFAFEWIYGDPSTALVQPASIVLSETLASTIFGDIDPVGKTLIGMHEQPFQVTGVIEDAPRDSHLSYDLLVSWSTTVPGVGPFGYSFMNNWLAQTLFTYLILEEGTDAGHLMKKSEDMMQRHFPERADQYFLQLQPLSEVYLFSDHITHIRSQKKGSIRFVYILAISALMILVIATVNYINITLSQASKSGLEVGVRKVLGSGRSQLMGRFLAQSALTTLTAAILGFALVYILLADINALTGKDLPASLLLTPGPVLFVILFGLLLSLIVGLYPAFIQSRGSAVAGIRGTGEAQRSGWFSRSLLSLQYGISAALIICTIIVYQQTQYLLNKPLGFDQDHLLILNINNEVGENWETLETEFLRHPGVKSVSISRAGISTGNYGTTVIPEGVTDELNIRLFGVDQEFFETYGIKTVEGRTFFKNSVADSLNLIVNQSFVEFMNWEDPLGKTMRFDEDDPQRFPIIGVVEDFHYHSLNMSTIDPAVMYLELQRQWNVSVKISGEDIPTTLAYMEGIWNKLAERSPFDYYFVDDWFNEQYSREKVLAKTAFVYASISILLCILGLFGIISLNLQHRMREISIRKVLGATTASLVALTSRRFILIVIIGLVAAGPLSFYLMREWLSQFPYHTTITADTFLLTTLILLVFSFAVVSLLAGRAASMNITTVLKKE